MNLLIWSILIIPVIYLGTQIFNTICSMFNNMNSIFKFIYNLSFENYKLTKREQRLLNYIKTYGFTDEEIKNAKEANKKDK